MVTFLGFFGINFTFWALIALIRYLTELFGRMLERQLVHRLNRLVYRKRSEISALLITGIVIAGIFFIAIAATTVDRLYEVSMIAKNITTLPLTIFFTSFVASLIWSLGFIVVGYVIYRMRKDRALESFIVIDAIAWFSVLLLTNADYTRHIISGEYALLLFLGTFLVMVIGMYVAREVDRMRKSVRVDAHTLERFRVASHEVAVVVPAHNEELSIRDTIQALKRIVPKENIYVGSDASTDRTVEIIETEGVKVDDIQPNRGKALVLKYLIEKYNLCIRYKAVLIIDADIIVDAHLLKNALPFFNDPNVCAVIGHAVPKWYHHLLPRMSMFVTAYRIRLWTLLIYTIRYAQTWKFTNVATIVPGGSSIYRTSALKKIEIDTKGLIIEDFNMTFQVHKKRLGKIAFTPQAYVLDQEPYSIDDFIKQVKRWYVGFWQTVFHHGFFPKVFWFTTWLFNIELIISSILTISIPIFIAAFAIKGAGPILSYSLFTFSEFTLTIQTFIVTIFLIDYAITVIIAVGSKKPALMIYGIGFFVLRIVDSVLFLYAIPASIFRNSDGRWVSPTRRSIRHTVT